MASVTSVPEAGAGWAGEVVGAETGGCPPLEDGLSSVCAAWVVG